MNIAAITDNWLVWSVMLVTGTALCAGMKVVILLQFGSGSVLMTLIQASIAIVGISLASIGATFLVITAVKFLIDAWKKW